MIFVSWALSLVALACWIIVIVKVFQSNNVVMGICSLCPLVAFIFGWMKSSELGLQKIMLTWTIIILVNIVISVVFGVSTGMHH